MMDGSDEKKMFGFQISSTILPLIFKRGLLYLEKEKNKYMIIS